ncbi:hypothetical protein RWE87_13775 [Sinorhizobium meliloti]|uniref:DUF7831 domain-containing protein n=1 Tax=Rhizobium meliloti TaxID=382 RepID=UPI00299F0F4C|nr:hypothetical protein [Sinorhizobium meliloti]MDX0267686.1 hypothetical protein [Sinorhizobium meliloti]
MPVLRQKYIRREDLQSNPETLYLFGDNDDRSGYGGQAKEMRDEENAVGVRTKWSPSNNRSAFFRDTDAEQVFGMIDEDLEPVIDHLRSGGTVVIPADGLGTGLSRLPETSPIIFNYLEERLAYLENF